MAGPPSDELLRMLPVLRRAVLCLGIIVSLEFAAGPGYIPAALTDTGTVLFGALLLRRDVQGVIHGLPTFVFVAGLNFAFQTMTLIQKMSSKPGAQYFFKTDCVVPVKRFHNGQEIDVNMDLCSWRTILGNIALVLGVILEFACMRFSWRMFKSMHDEEDVRAASTSFLPMMDLEGASGSALLHSHNSLEARLQAVGAPGIQLSQQPERDSLTRLNGPPSNITPFSGQPHRLGE